MSGYVYVRPGKRKDLTGKRFGNLLVLREVDPVVAKSGALVHWWECMCDCGKPTTVRRNGLTSGGTKSCGCKQKESVRRMARERRLSPGRSQRNILLKSYKTAAANRELVWALTDEQFDALISGDCHYCDAEPVPPRRRKVRTNLYGEFTYNGIDRLDNTLGYVVGNVVSCCIHCNKMKNNRTVQEFLQHIQLVLEFCRSAHSDYLVQI